MEDKTEYNGELVERRGQDILQEACCVDNAIGQRMRNVEALISTGSKGFVDHEPLELWSESEEEEYLKDDDDEETGPAVKPRLMETELHEPPDWDIPLETMENITEDGGVKKLVMKEGSGRPIPSGSKIWFHYVSFTEQDQTPFDSTVSRKSTQSCQLDDPSGTNILAGLYLGLKTMEFQEISQFMISPRYAYGQMGCPPRIPKNCTIIIKVKVLDYLTPDTLSQVKNMSSKERAALPFAEIRGAAEEKKLEGNSLYKAQNYQAAVNAYKRGISMLEEYSNVTTEENLVRDEILVVLYTNKAQSYLKINKAPQACNACKIALICNIPLYRHKIYYRFAQAKFILGDYTSALELIRKSLAASSSPVRKEIIDFEKKILHRIEEGNTSYTQMCKKMIVLQEREVTCFGAT